MHLGRLIYLMLFTVVISFGGSAQGEVVAQYSFTDVEPAVLNRNATTVAANVTAGGITDAPIVFTHPMVQLVRSTGIGYATEPLLSASRAPWNESNIPENVYFSFTVTPDSGYELNLDELAFNVARGGASTPRTYDIRTSVDGFAASLTGSIEITTERPTFTPVSVNLSGPEFQNLTSPLTFRIHFFTPTFNQNLDFDDITINGTVAIAAPSLVGDYNGNLQVDAADYTVWRDTLGSTADLRANGDSTGTSAGIIDEADYTVWKSNYGNSGSGQGGLAATAVPEPSSVVLIVLAIWGLGRVPRGGRCPLRGESRRASSPPHGRQRAARSLSITY